MDERLLSGESAYEDADLEYSLRPTDAPSVYWPR